MTIKRLYILVQTDRTKRILKKDNASYFYFEKQIYRGKINLQSHKQDITHERFDNKCFWGNHL